MAKQISGLAKFLRKLRVDNDEDLADMASRLGMSSSMLSACETGGRRFKPDFAIRVIKEYSLNDEEARQLLVMHAEQIVIDRVPLHILELLQEEYEREY